MATASSRKIFVNLAVKDLSRAVEFFTQLGFSFDSRFTDEQATCMIVSEEAFVMLLVESPGSRTSPRRSSVTRPRTRKRSSRCLPRAASRSTSSCTTRLAAGGQPANEPMDHGFMYGSSFQDLDGHLWEVIWMDPSALQESPLAEEQRAHA